MCDVFVGTLSKFYQNSMFVTSPFKRAMFCMKITNRPMFLLPIPPNQLVKKAESFSVFGRKFTFFHRF